MELRAGDRFDRYLIESVIGRGGMGVVYLARDSHLDRRVALKVLAPGLADDEGFRARFVSEARLAASLDEPHVVPVFEAGEYESQLFLTMRYVAGMDLQTMLRQNGPMSPKDAVGMVEQLAAAIDAAHAAGLIHRDIKPANVLLSGAAATGHVYLTDFGLARTSAQRGLTLAGQFVGTIEYAAPEQIENGPMDGRTDIYALGGVLFAALTGHPPFEGDGVYMLFARLQSPPRNPSTLNAAVNEKLDAVVVKALSVKAGDRFATAGDFAVAARAALTTGDETIAARTRVGQTTPTRPGGARKTVTVMCVGLIGADGDEAVDPELVDAGMARGEQLVYDAVSKHGGVLDSIVGDHAVCVFGVPLLHEDDALRAARAALDLATRVGGIGIATGEVLATGDSTRGRVTGEPVNVATRLGLAAQPTEILLAESTYRFVRDEVVAESREVVAAGRSSTAMVLRSIHEDGGRPQAETALVGREVQLEALLDHWRRAVAERSPRLVTIVGSAGIGKSRLAFELADRIDGRSVAGRCLPYGEGITYWPIREIILNIAGVTDADAVSRAQGRIAELLAADPDGPALAALVATAINLGRTDAPQSEVFWAVRRLFEDLSRNQPTLFLIEDLEWAEETLLDLIEYVVDLASDAPMLIVATSRPEVLERRPGWGTGREKADLLRLDPLVPESALELVRAQPGGSALPNRLAQRIGLAADGNPLFVEEIVRALRDSPTLSNVDGQWIFSGDPEVLDVPPTVRALLETRIEHLPEEERVVLERAAVMGRRFEVEALAALLPDLERAALADLLHSLVRRELIQPDRAQGSSGDAFAFRHMLVRDAAYSSLPKSRRAELHTEAARWLTQAAGARLNEYAEIVGYHLAEAHDYRVAFDEDAAATDELAREAAGYLRTAGERALSRGDLQAAAKLLSRSVALTPPGTPQVAETLVVQASVQRSMGEFKQARETLRLVLEMDARDEAVDLRARIEWVLSAIQTASLDSQRLTPQIDDLRSRVEALGDDQITAMMCMAEGSVQELEGRNSDAARTFARALDIAERGRFGRLRSEALSRVLLNELLGLTPVSEALARCEQVIEQTNEPRTVGATLDTYALLLAMGDRTTDALAAEQRAFKIAADLVDRLDEGLYRSQTLGVVYALAGDLETARTEALTGCQLLLDLDAQAWLSTAACVLGEIELARGNGKEAARWLAVAESSSAETDIDARTRAAVLRCRIALVNAPAGLAPALTLMRDAGTAVEKTQLLYLRGIVQAAEACVAASNGDIAQARAHLANAAAIHDKKGDVARSRRATELSERLSADREAWRLVPLV